MRPAMLLPLFLLLASQGLLPTVEVEWGHRLAPFLAQPSASAILDAVSVELRLETRDASSGGEVEDDLASHHASAHRKANSCWRTTGPLSARPAPSSPRPEQPRAPPRTPPRS